MAVKTDGYAEGHARRNQTNFDLIIVKMDGYAEARARRGQVLESSGQTSV